MSRFRKKGKGVTLSLDEMVRGGATSAYEALQLHKSQVSRLRAAGRLEEALSMSCQAAVMHLKEGYENAGNELGALFVSIMLEGKLPLSPDYRNLINEISTNFDSVHNRGIPFLKDCINLTKETGTRIYGDAILQRQLADKLWNSDEGDNGEVIDDYKTDSILHYALAEAPEALWMKILDDPTMDPDTAKWTGNIKREQVAVLGVLYFLSFENLRDAHILFKKLKEYRKAVDLKRESLLFEFTDRLLLTSVREAPKLFKELVKAYREQLEFHSIALQLLEGPIAKKLYGIMPPPSLMTMMSSMFT